MEATTRGRHRPAGVQGPPGDYAGAVGPRASQRTFVSSGAGFPPQLPSLRLAMSDASGASSIMTPPSATPSLPLSASSSSSAFSSSSPSSSASSSAYYPSAIFPLGWPSRNTGGLGGVPLLQTTTQLPAAAAAVAPLAAWGSTSTPAAAAPPAGLVLAQPQGLGAQLAQRSGGLPLYPYQQQRVLQVVARLAGIGSVSVCVEAGSKVQDLIMCIETQVWGACGVPVEVRKLSDSLGIDLPPSYEVGKLLDSSDDSDRAADPHYVVHAHFRRLDTHPLPSPIFSSSSSSSSSVSATSATSSSPRTASSAPISIPTNATASSSSSSSSSTSSCSPTSTSPRQRVAQLAFVESPPTTILQNKEFCFTVAFTLPSDTPEEAEQAWRSPDAGKLLKVAVACEAGEAVPEQNFTVRTMVMTEGNSKDMIGVFGRLRVNSYYGRKRYLIRVFCADAVGWRSNTLTSDPVTVLSKKCKHRTKRTKETADEGDADDADADADQPLAPT